MLTLAYKNLWFQKSKLNLAVELQQGSHLFYLQIAKEIMDE